MSELFDNALEKATKRLLAHEGKVYDAFADLGTGLHPREVENWIVQRLKQQHRTSLSVGQTVGQAMTVAMLAVDADRRTRASVAIEYAQDEWTRDAEWQERVDRQHELAGLMGDPPKAWRRTPLQAILGHEQCGGYDPPRWHLSVAHMERIPTWEELVDAAHALRPGVVFCLGLPPRSWWLNYDERVLHLWEIRDEALIANWRAANRMDTPT